MDIETFVTCMAAQMDLPSLKVSLGKKCQLNKIEVHTLHIETPDRYIETLLAHDELIGLQNDTYTGHLETRVKIALKCLTVPECSSPVVH